MPRIAAPPPKSKGVDQASVVALKRAQRYLADTMRELADMKDRFGTFDVKYEGAWGEYRECALALATVLNTLVALSNSHSAQPAPTAVLRQTDQSQPA